MTTIRDIKEVRKILGYLQKLNQDNLDDKNKFKIIKVGSSKWTNVYTMKPETVNNIWFLGWQSSSRPYIINRFDIVSSTENNTYIINDSFTHVNIAKHQDGRVICHLKGDGKKLPDDFNLYVYGQEFCNPITALHILEGNDKDMANLLKVTLMSQNFDDGYGECKSVANSYFDAVIVCPKTGKRLLKHNSSPIELISNLSSDAIRRKNEFEINDLLRSIASIGENEVFAKKKSQDGYEKVSKRSYRNSINSYSKYYPVYDYEAIKKMKIEVPKNRFDIGVYGLGSAGTAILDQVCRSNWLNSIYLCDFDLVEAKNLINQWYDKYDIHSNKVLASQTIIENLERTMPKGQISTKFLIRSDVAEFQKTKMEENCFKYVVSGFDSIKVRQDFLNAILDGKIEAKYLIDCRYLDLSCSIYFIDIENSEELNFYKANLDADAELILARNMKEKLTREEFIDWMERKGYFESGCRRLRTEYLNSSDLYCMYKDKDYNNHCRDNGCIDYIYDLYIKSLPNDKISRNDASCVKYNYIDIYKYVGAIIFGAMRRIENGDKKPFTQIEAQTDIKGLPNYMVVKE